ncbi:type I restriction enzyme S subunit [Lactococcus lactis]|uniref:Type I restriction enzyme S subunit n=1 Tax=Lactococcus lactis TaxID=1358 RepID=A0AAW5TIC0_9LACT|nr:type I restriction enzyme S subunit [Lactococcus lactis]
MIKDVDTFVVPKGNSVISEGNEVIVPASGETSEDISRAAVVGKSGILLGGDLNIIKPKSNLNSVFLAFTISNGSQQKELSTRAQGNSVVHLYNSELKKVNLLFPSLEEQEKIGSFFIHLDHLIALHQRKLDKLKQLKQGYLQQIFPQNGEKVPRVRFANFEHVWEQCRLGDLTQIKTGSSDLQDAVEGGEYPFFVRSENIERSNRYIFDGEAILIPGEGRLGEIYHYINGKFDFHQRVYKISGFADSDTDGKYVLYYMQKNFKQHAMKFTVKATVDSLRLPMLTDFNLVAPKIEEQREISAFFSNLDTLINFHQSKLDKLKLLKQALLQKTFI